MASPRRRLRGLRLFALYVLASIVPITLIGVVSIRADAEAGAEFGLDWGRAQANVIEEMVVAPALRGADLSLGLDQHEREHLQSATDLAIFDGTVAHLRLRSFTGTVKFADDGKTSDALPASDPAFQSAAAGRTDARIMEYQHDSPVVRVLQPVIAATSGQATGVLEVYLPYEAIAAKVQADTQAEITQLGVSLVGLFAFLALISWWTTRSLRQNAATSEHQSLHDPLTGLPNRELFRLRAEDALARGRRGRRGALVLIDLDSFKKVNDTLGHHAGDELLRIVGRRLSSSLRTDDTVARLGGDEFAMVLPSGASREETLALVYRVRHELGEDVVLDGVSLSVQACFGICFYPDSAETVEDLLRHADAAMHLGKQDGPGGIVIHEAVTPRAATHALVIQRELRGALDRDELVLHYQPTLELGTGKVTCLEALVRWQHPKRGLLLPSEFLSVAERSELIEPLTSWVLSRALADCRTWTEDGHSWMVSVNVSARNLTSPGFAASVGLLLRQAGLLPDRLRLEVSEAALALDADLTRAAIGALAGSGISISIDHFGMGLPNLAQMNPADVSEIKIDQTFLADLAVNDQDRAVVRSVIQLGHDLGCLITAQGVESQEVADALEEAGCDQAQGYLWLPPCLWTEVARMFADQKAPISR